jgi:RNA recognition motif-containing protein
MSSKLYVGNLSFQTSEEDLGNYFGAAGTVASVKIITDRETGRSRGFGFVEMSSPEEAQAAVDQFNGQEHNGRNLKVDIAKERDSRPPRRN